MAPRLIVLPSLVFFPLLWGWGSNPSRHSAARLLSFIGATKCSPSAHVSPRVFPTPAAEGACRSRPKQHLGRVRNESQQPGYPGRRASCFVGAWRLRSQVWLGFRRWVGKNSKSCLDNTELGRSAKWVNARPEFGRL